MNRAWCSKASAVLAWALCSCQGPPSTPGSASTRLSAATPPGVLDALDSRAPVPLLPMMANHQKQNMRDHLVAIQDIVGALAGSDFVAVESAARRIGFSDQMGQMCNHMGAGAPGFSTQAVGFHQTADRVAEAARSHDGGAVLRELAATLQACTSCHATWKQQIVDEAQWRQLTENTNSSKGSRDPM
jgi:hypothetical protein